jgi:ribosome maturation factor RimP
MGRAPYVLEVTSPGAERPLTEPRHYRRSVGRLVRVVPHEGAEFTGRLTAADETGADFEVPGARGRAPAARRVEFAEIARARVELEFSRRAAAGDDSQKEA